MSSPPTKDSDVSRADILAGRLPTFGGVLPREGAVAYNWQRTAEVVLCNAPLVSIVRPSLGLGLLHAALARMGVTTLSIYLNLFFAGDIGIDFNEFLAERTPSQLLVGDWLFSEQLGDRGACTRQSFLDEVRSHVGPLGFELLMTARENVVGAFVERYAREIVAMQPKIVGFSTVFQQTAASLAFAKKIKELRPETVVCFGGANCHGEMGPEWLKQFDQIDFVFTGEADESFPQLVGEILAGRSLGPISGVNSRNRSPVGRSPSLHNLDSLPFPEYSDYFEQLSSIPDAHRVNTCIPFESSRGCWWGQKQHCTFCGLNGELMNFRAKSADRVLQEIDHLRHYYGVYRFLATDDIMSIGHIKDVFGPLSKRPLDLPGTSFFYEVKANLNEDQLRILAEAGVTFVQPGIESFSDAVLKIMRKGVTGALNLRFLRTCSEIGIAAAWSILYGFPGEPDSAYEEMIELISKIEHLPPPMGLGSIRLDRFSPNFDDPATFGFGEPTPFTSYDSIYKLPRESLAKVAYFFTAPGAGAAGEVLKRLGCQIERWQSSWHNFETRPRLEIIEGDAFEILHDTRSCAQYPLVTLSDLMVEIIDATRSPVSMSQIVQRIGDNSTSLDATLKELIEMGAVLDWNGLYLSLPTRRSRRILGYDVRQTIPYGYVSPLTA